MTRGVLRSAVGAAAMAGLLSLGGCLGLGCPCGSDPSEPLSEHDPSYAGRHALELECQCQCGDDHLVAQPRDRACSDYEAPCVARDGQSRTLVCD